MYRGSHQGKSSKGRKRKENKDSVAKSEVVKKDVRMPRKFPSSIYCQILAVSLQAEDNSTSYRNRASHRHTPHHVGNDRAFAH